MAGGTKKKLPEKKINMELHKQVIETPTGKAVSGGIDAILPDIQKDMPSAFGILFGDNTKSVTNWKGITASLKNNSLFSETRTIATSVKDVVTSLETISTSMTKAYDSIQFISHVSDTLDKFVPLASAYFIDAMKDGAKSDLSIVLDDKSAAALGKTADAMKKIDDGMVKTLGSLLNVLKEYQKIDLAGLADKVIVPINSLQTVDTKTLQKTMSNLYDALNGKTSLADVLTELSDPKYNKILTPAQTAMQELGNITYIIGLLANDLSGDKRKQITAVLEWLKKTSAGDDSSLQSVLSNLAFDTSKIQPGLLGLYGSLENLRTALGSLAQVASEYDPSIEKALEGLHSLASSESIALHDTLQALSTLPTVKKETEETLMNLALMIESMNNIGVIANEKSMKENKKAIAALKETIDGSTAESLQSVLDALASIKLDSADFSKKIEALDSSADSLVKLLSKDYKEAEKNSKDMLSAFIKLAEVMDKLPEINTKKGVDKKAAQICKMMTGYQKNMHTALEAQKQGTADAEAIVKGTDKMAEAIEDANDSISSVDTKSANVAISNLSGVIVAMGAMMMIGSMITRSDPDFIKNAFKFGSALVVFITMTVASILIMESIVKPKTQVAAAGYGRLVAALAATMVIGAMVYKVLGNDFSKNVMRFTRDLTIFTICIAIPLNLMKRIIANEKAPIAMARFVTRCAIVMIIGAFFMMAQGGKLAKNAILFGAVLGLFLLCVTAPLMLFALLKNSALESMAGASRLIVTCTIVMLIGAFFVKNKELVKNSLKFGVILGAFLALVLLPVVIAGAILPRADKAIRAISRLITVTALMMMLGGLFMTNQKLATGALKFALLAGLFIAGITLSIAIGGRIMGKKAKSFVRELTSVIIALSLALLIGGVFMANRALSQGAIKFAGLLVVFTLGMMLVMKAVAKTFNRNSQNAVRYMIICTLALAGVLMLGTMFLKMFGPDNALYFALILVGFSLMMSITMKAVSKTFTKRTQEAVRQMLICTASLAAVLILGTIVLQKYGWQSAALFAGILSVFVLAMVGIFALIGREKIRKRVQQGAIVAEEMAIAIGLLGIAFTLVHLATYNMEWQELLMFGAGVAGMAVIFGIIGLDKVREYVALGAFVAEDMAVAVGLLGIAFGFVHLAMQNMEWEELLKFGVAVVGVVAVFAILGIPVVAELVALGAIVAAAVGVALTLLVMPFMLIGLLAEMDVVGGAQKICEGIMALMETFVIMGLLSPFIALGAVVGALLGAALITISLGFGLLSLIAGMDIVGGANKLAEGLTALMIPFTLMGVLSPLIALGSVVGVVLSAALIVLSGAFALLAVVGKLDIVGGANKLAEGLYALMIPFTILGVGMPVFALASAAGIVMSVALLTLSGSFALLSFICENHDIVSAAETLNEALEKLYVPLGILGVAVPLIVLAGVSAGLLSGAVAKLGIAFGILHANMTDDAVKDVENLKTALGDDNSGMLSAMETLKEYGVIKMKKAQLVAKQVGYATSELGIAFGILHEAVGDADLSSDISKLDSSIGTESSGMIGIMVRIESQKKTLKESIGAIRSFNSAARLIGKATKRIVKAVEKSKDITIDDVYTFENILTTTIRIFNAKDPASRLHDIDFKELRATAKEIKRAMRPIVRISSDLFKTVKDFATLMVPDDWNNEGKPIHYIRLKKEDFTEAANTVGLTMLTLLRGMKQIQDDPMVSELIQDFTGGESGGGVFGFFKRLKASGKSKFAAVIRMTSAITKVVGNLGATVGRFAMMMVPDDWNKDGIAIHYRQLNKADFTNAAECIVTVLETTLSGIDRFANKYSTLLDEYANERLRDSRIGQSMMVSWAISRMLSTLATGISNYAQLRVPDDWNKGGVAIHYRQLEPKDFTDMATNIETILSGMISAVNNSVDHIWAVWSFEYIVDRLVDPIGKLSEMLGQVAKTIVDYASLRIPIFKEGKLDVAGYENLSTQHFKDFAENVKTVLTAMPEAVMAAAKAAWSNGSTTSDIKTYSENFLPMADLLAKIVGAIKDYASMKAMPIYDKDGKIVDYIRIDFENDLKSMGTNVGSILTGMSKALSEGYSYFQDYIADDPGKIEKIVKGIEPIGTLFESLVKGVVAYAELKVPKYNNKGEIAGYYTLIDDPNGGMDKLFEGITGNITKILTGLINSVTGAINNCSWLTDDSKRIEVGKSIQSINEILEPVNNLVDLMKKYSELKFPTGFAADGKATGFVTLDKFNFTKFETAMTTMMTSVPKAVFNAAKDAKQYLDELVLGKTSADRVSLDSFSSAFQEISEFISEKILPTVQSYVEFKIPIAFDKDGKPTKYYEISVRSMNNLEKVMTSIIVAVPNAMKNALEKTKFGAEELANMKFFAWAVSRGSELLKTIYDGTATTNISEAVSNGYRYTPLLEDMKTLVAQTDDAFTNHINKSLVELFEGLDSTFINGKFSEQDRVNITIATMQGLRDFIRMLDSIALFNEVNFLAVEYTTSQMINLVKLTDKMLENHTLQSMEDFFNSALDNFVNTSMNHVMRQNTISGTKAMVEDFVELLNVFTNIGSTERRFANGFGLISVSSLDSYSKKVQSFSELAIKLSEVSGSLLSINETVNKIDPNSAENAREFIERVNEALSNVDEDGTKRLKKQNLELMKYVKTINAIDINKVNRMNIMFETLNRLSASLGDLPKFTDALANKIAVVLDEFTAELRNAEVTIANADKLRAERQKTMDKTLEKIKGIMSQTMNINVSSSSGDTIEGSYKEIL